MLELGIRNYIKSSCLICVLLSYFLHTCKTAMYNKEFLLGYSCSSSNSSLRTESLNLCNVIPLPRRRRKPIIRVGNKPA